MGQTVAYGRVSTQQQADQGALESQERALLEAAGADMVILDVGSGKTTSRPGYQRLLELISSGEVEQVFVADQDRLNRNLQADLELWSLCDANGTRITDLNGREIEFRSPDGELLSTVVSALNQHRSRAYGAKTRRGLDQARKQGLPARPRVPFGFRKVRNEQGRFVAIEPDPETVKLARERIDWFLSGKGLTGTCRLIGENHPRETWMQPIQLKRWLKNPSLTGRLCWHKRGNSGDFDHIEAKPSFQGIASDSEAEKISNLIEGLSTGRARAGRRTRTLSGLAQCADCKEALSHKVSGKNTWYLRCSNPYCPKRSKCIRLDKTIKVTKSAITASAFEISRQATEPDDDPQEVYQLREEIKKLREIRGTEELVRSKENEIATIRSKSSNHSKEQLLITMLNQDFWRQEEELLNSNLRGIIEKISIRLGNSVKDSRVETIRLRINTNPFAAIPANQEEPEIYQPAFAYSRTSPDGREELIAAVRWEEIIAKSLKKDITLSEGIATGLETALNQTTGNSPEINDLIESLTRAGEEWAHHFGVKQKKGDFKTHFFFCASLAN